MVSSKPNRPASVKFENVVGKIVKLENTMPTKNLMDKKLESFQSSFHQKRPYFGPKFPIFFNFHKSFELFDFPIARLDPRLKPLTESVTDKLSASADFIMRRTPTPFAFPIRYELFFLYWAHFVF